MATHIDPVDNLIKPPPQKRVNPADRSSEEHQQRQFKKVLDKQMDSDKEDTADSTTGDAVVIEKDSQDEQSTSNREEAPVKKSADDLDDEASETAADDHIDLRA
jgi:hypothetical protein